MKLCTAVQEGCGYKDTLCALRSFAPLAKYFTVCINYQPTYIYFIFYFPYCGVSEPQYFCLVFALNFYKNSGICSVTVRNDSTTKNAFACVDVNEQRKHSES